jgi:hypothetical protein
MFRTARFVPLLLTLWVAPTFAASCLQQVDNISVEFDLPAAKSMFGNPGDPNYITPPPDQPITAPPRLTTTPPGRPGAPRGGMESGTIGPPPVLAHERLKAAQRDKLVGILRQARSAEALGNETKCFELLREAEVITKQSG